MLKNIHALLSIMPRVKLSSYNHSCQKPKKLLKVVEVVKSGGATEAHPWRGRRGAGVGGGGLTT